MLSRVIAVKLRARVLAHAEACARLLAMRGILRVSFCTHRLDKAFDS
jgi:hypothetical protein